MSLEIRKAEPQDYEDFIRLCGNVDRLHTTHLPWIFCTPQGPTRTLDYYRERLADPASLILLATLDRDPVGFVVAFLRETPPVPIMIQTRFLVIDNLGVQEQHRGRGAGTALMYAAEEWGLKLGATRVELNVYFFNENAIRLYEELGYTATCQRMVKPLSV